MKCSVILLLLSILPLAATTSVKIGDHPTSRLTLAPAIKRLHAHGGRIYMGYGEETNYPAVFLVCYDPASNAFRVEHSAGSDNISTYRSIGGVLYAPHADSAAHEDARDYSYLSADGIWRDAAPIGGVRVDDMAVAGSRLYICGWKPSVEGNPGNATIHGRLADDALAPWSLDYWLGGTPNFAWCQSMGSRLYFQNGWLENGQGTFGSPSSGSTLTLSVPVEGQPALLTRQQGLGNGLSLFNGATFVQLHPTSEHFTLEDGVLYSVHQDNLTGRRRVWRASFLSLQGAVWAPTEAELDAAHYPTSFAVTGRRAYFGMDDGSLRAANLDGTPVTLTAPAVVQALPDSFGRALATSGTLLVCGAPDAFTTMTAAGRAEIWQETAAAPGWVLQQALPAPGAQLSGWFGKDAALSGDVLALVEPGRDSSSRNRGSSAQVHVYQQSGSNWVSRSILQMPYVTGAAVLPDFLAVASSTPGTSGSPGVTPYRLTRAGNGVVSLSAQTVLRPVQAKWGYRPVSRVVMQGDMLAASFAGDYSRMGGQGMVCLWRRTAAGTSFVSAPEQEIFDESPSHYGYALALDGLWLAVGAPREDTAAMQAGAVYLYRRLSLTTPFVPAQTLRPTSSQNEARFGCSLALRGNTLMVGASGTAVNGVAHTGAVYLYQLDSGGTWTLAGEMPRPAASLSEFGVEVAMTDSALVAASRLSSNAAPGMSRLSFLPHPEPRTALALWRTQAGVSATAPPTSDADADGLSDLVEYALNLSPSSADAGVFAAGGLLRGQPGISHAASPGTCEVLWVQRSDDPRVSSILESGSDGMEWTAVPAAQTQTMSTTGGLTLQRSTISIPTGGRLFFRQRINYSSQR